MKNNKLKLITLMLLVILIIMVGFFGVYSKNKGNMENTVKDYSYMTNIKGARVANIKLSNSTKSVIKDKEGNEIKKATEEEIENNGYIKEDEPVNKEEQKNQENYELAKHIIKTRLEKVGVQNYIIRLDEENGNIVLELPENEDTDNILNLVTTTGKFEIVDADTEEVLLGKDDIETSNIYRNSTQYGTELSFSIEFNDEGAKKFEEITGKYVSVKEEDNEDNSSENSNEATVETKNNSTENNVTANEETEEKKEKKVALKLDDTELMSTSFEEPVKTGKMYLTVGQAATTSEDVKSNYTQAQKMSTLLSTKTMPLTYEKDTSTFVQSKYNGEITNIILIGSAIVIAIVLVILMLKYKGTGLLAGICYAGFTALLLLTIRYWNVDLSLEGVVAIFIVMALNFIFVIKILEKLNKEKDNRKEEPKHVINMAIKENTMKLIPLFIFAIVFAFAGWETTVSFGMVMFWGLALMELYNLFITKNILIK